MKEHVEDPANEMNQKRMESGNFPIHLVLGFIGIGMVALGYLYVANNKSKVEYGPEYRVVVQPPLSNEEALKLAAETPEVRKSILEGLELEMTNVEVSKASGCVSFSVKVRKPEGVAYLVNDPADTLALSVNGEPWPVVGYVPGPTRILMIENETEWEWNFWTKTMPPAGAEIRAEWVNENAGTGKREILKSTSTTLPLDLEASPLPTIERPLQRRPLPYFWRRPVRLEEVPNTGDRTTSGKTDLSPSMFTFNWEVGWSHLFTLIFLVIAIWKIIENSRLKKRLANREKPALTIALHLQHKNGQTIELKISAKNDSSVDDRIQSVGLSFTQDTGVATREWRWVLIHNHPGQSISPTAPHNNWPNTLPVEIPAGKSAVFTCAGYVPFRKQKMEAVDAEYFAHPWDVLLKVDGAGEIREKVWMQGRT